MVDARGGALRLWYCWLPKVWRAKVMVAKVTSAAAVGMVTGYFDLSGLL